MNMPLLVNPDHPAHLVIAALRGAIIEAIGEIKAQSQYILIERAAKLWFAEERIYAVLLLMEEPYSRGALDLHDLYLKCSARTTVAFKHLGFVGGKPVEKEAPGLDEIFGKNGKKQKELVSVKESNPIVMSQLLGTIPTVESLNPVRPQREEQIKIRRAAMFDRLGGKCVCMKCKKHKGKMCGSTKRLEPDHKDGRVWKPDELSLERRMDQYEADERAAKLQLLCRSCNGADGAKRWQGKPRWKNDKRSSKDKSKTRTQKVA